MDKWKLWANVIISGRRKGFVADSEEEFDLLLQAFAEHYPEVEVREGVTSKELHEFTALRCWKLRSVKRNTYLCTNLAPRVYFLRDEALNQLCEERFMYFLIGAHLGIFFVFLPARSLPRKHLRKLQDNCFSEAEDKMLMFDQDDLT